MKQVSQKIHSIRGHITRFYQRHSTLAFFVTLAGLFALIAGSHALRAPKPEPEKPVAVVKESALFNQENPVYLEALSTVEKKGITNIVALAPGIVSAIYVRPGQAVGNGSSLVTLTNDYNGGASGLQKAIAQNNLELTKELTALDKDIQRNEEKLIKRNDLLTKTQEESALDTLKKAKVSREFNLTNATLSAQLAYASDAVLRPRSLTSGFVQNIPVTVGQYVAPGQTLAVITNPKNSTVMRSAIPSDRAKFIDITKPAKMTLANGAIYEIMPSYFSTSEDADGMFLVEFTLPPEVAEQVSLSASPRVQIPLRFTHDGAILAPLDAVYVQGENATVMVLSEGKVEARNVRVGNIFGSFVEILEGLTEADSLILNRNVSAGETLSVIQ